MRSISTTVSRCAALLLCTGVALSAPRPASPAGSSLEAALASVTAEDISADLHFIASDELGGRDTPSLGLRVAARFLRARLQRLGWEPGAEHGYFFEYPLEVHRIDEAASSAELVHGGERVELRWGRDYFFPGRDLADVDVEGEVVFCGEGGKEDFGAADARDRWALCLDGDLHWRRRERYATDAGARGVLVVPGPQYSGDPYALRFQRDSDGALRGKAHWPSSKEEDAVFPHVYLSGDVAASVFGDLVGAPPPVGTDLGVQFHERRALVGDDGLVTLENVCGFWPGSDPVLGQQVIIVSAHYDHVGQQPNGDIYNGADDNGSGTCGLLAVAQMLRTHGPLRRSVLLLWVSGEEKGLLGSRAWTESPWLPGGRHAVCDINIDMIGRNAPDYLLVTPTKQRREYNGLVRLAEQLAPGEGFPKLGSCDDYWARSDHMNFAKNLEIPVMFLFSDVHEDYHRPTDTADKIDYDKVLRISRLVVRMLDGLQADELKL